MAAGYWLGACCLEFPQLGQFEEHVIRIHFRHEQADRAVAESPSQQVIADEGESRVEKHLERVGATPFRQPLLRRQRRVFINGREVMRDVAVRVMLEFVAKDAWWPVGFDRFVDSSSIP